GAYTARARPPKPSTAAYARAPSDPERSPRDRPPPPPPGPARATEGADPMNAPVNGVTRPATDRPNVHALPPPPGDTWDVPVPLSQSVRPPSFPIEVFPAWLAEMVTATAVF